MRKLALYRLETPYREPTVIRGFEFGDKRGARAAAVVGSTRGNEIQQDYICARLVSRLARIEEKGQMAPHARVLVVPCVNPFSMNIGSRFWPLDKTDVNRQFPGDARGETTQRLAAGLFDTVRAYSYGIQLCSFYMPGSFEPHVRVTRAGDISRECLELADDFGLPYVVAKRPGPFDTKMLNYNWQSCGTHAFSLYSEATDAIDETSATMVEEAILRFLGRRGILRTGVAGGTVPIHVEESRLVDVRTETAAGFLMGRVRPADHVEQGQLLAEVLDTYDTRVREQLVSPVAGRVFFCRVAPLVQQDIICFRIVPDSVLDDR